MSEHKHTNRLLNEKSPYLLQKAHNPVNWFPWGPEAFEKAKREDKPVFLSIGYDRRGHFSTTEQIFEKHLCQT